MNKNYIIFNSKECFVKQLPKSNFGVKAKNIDSFRIETMMNRLKELNDSDKISE